MKKLLLILLTLPLFVKAQDKNPYPYFKVENNALVFENIYDTTNVNALALKQLLLQQINNLPNTANIHSNDSVITGKIIKGQFPYKQYGLNGIQLNACFTSDFHCNFIINVRDNKYRVKITGMYFDISDFHDAMVRQNNIFGEAMGSTFTMEQSVFRNKRFTFRTASNAIEINTAIEHWLYDLFWIHSSDNW